MSDIELTISMPLDEEGYFRRECPLCMKEFKVLLTQEELTDFTQNGLNSFLIETKENTEDAEDKKDRSEQEHHCPYCGQSASKGSWWTQEQLKYLDVFAHNILSKIINENLIWPMKRTFGAARSPGLVSMEFKGNEMQQQEPWISGEENDLQVFDLPCCERKIKINEAEGNSAIYCFFCGFPHKKLEKL